MRGGVDRATPRAARRRRLAAGAASSTTPRCTWRCPPTTSAPASSPSELRELQAGLLRDGATAPLRAQAEEVCERARRLLAHRHHLVDELHRLTLEMSAGLAEVAEEGSWVKGQTESLQLSLGDSPSVRSVRAASEMLAQTRARQHAGARGTRQRARWR